MAELLSHEAAIELLPWLANGTLAAGERGPVRAHAQSCVICRRELEVLEAFARPAAREARDFSAPPPDMRRINARIDAEFERARRGSALAAGVRRWAANPWRVAFVFQSLVVLALGAWLMQAAEQPAYRTLTAPVFPGDGHYLRVVFDPGLPVAGIDERLTVHGLTQESEPSARGVYTLRFDESADAAERDAALAALRADRAVLFVQPAGAERSP